MLDHLGFAVSDFDRSLRFYEQALAPLGIGIIMQIDASVTGADRHAGFGESGKPYFWIGSGKPLQGTLHVAFAAADRSMVQAFYDAALAASGTDNGPPGLRQHYHPNYFGAFVRDPDGHNVEAVCHLPE